MVALVISYNAGPIRLFSRSFYRQHLKARICRLGRWVSVLVLANALAGCLTPLKPFKSAENLFTTENTLPLADFYPGKSFAADIRQTALGGYIAIVKLNGKAWVASRQDLKDVEFRAIDRFHTTDVLGGRTVILINHRDADDPDWLKGPSDGTFEYAAINMTKDGTWSLLLPDPSGETEVKFRRGLYRAARKALETGKIPQSIDLREVPEARFQLYLNEIVRSLGSAMGHEVSLNCDQGFAMHTSSRGNWRAQSVVWMGGAAHTAFRSKMTREVAAGKGTKTKLETSSKRMFSTVRFTTIGHDPSTPRTSAPITDLFLQFPHIVSTDPANPMPKIIDIIRGDVEAEIQLELNGEPFASFPMRTSVTDFETPAFGDHFKVGIRIMATFNQDTYGKLFEHLYDASSQPGAVLTYRGVFGDGRTTPTYATDLDSFDKVDESADQEGRRMRELCVPQ